MGMVTGKTVMIAAFSAALLGSSAAQDAVAIGGMTPSIRPPNAPSINAIHHGPAWYAAALRGITEPYPKSLFFLDHQGQWYTPFNHPGMPGYYDIRGLHKRP